MGVRSWFRRAGRTAFGYDAVTRTDGFRRSSPSKGSEDAELTREQRDRLVAQTRDLNRNFGLAGWAVRRYLDFTASFTFRAVTKSPEFNRELEAFIDYASEPLQFDASGRHSLRRALRLSEARRVIDGDIGWLKLQDLTTQFIEGDRIRQPNTAEEVGAADLAAWCHGVKLDERGRSLAYAIHKRSGAGRFEFEKTVPASRLFLHAHYDSGRFDQVRGVSRFAASLNTLRHCYESIDSSLMKQKLHSLMGLALYRTPDNDLIDQDDEGCEQDDPYAEWQFDPNAGPFTLKLSKDDKVDLLESKTPSAEFQEFTKLCILLGLSALDIPFAILDTSANNYAGIQAALTLLMKAAEEPRKDNCALLSKWTRWRVGSAVARGELDPTKYGLTFDDIRWSWFARGVPYLDKERQVNGDKAAVDAGFQTVGMVIEERFGLRIEDVMLRRKEEEDLMRSLGITLPASQPAATAPPSNPKDGGNDAEAD